MERCSVTTIDRRCLLSPGHEGRCYFGARRKSVEEQARQDEYLEARRWEWDEATGPGYGVRLSDNEEEGRAYDRDRI